MQSATNNVADSEVVTPVDKYEIDLRQKILFGLSVYPFVSPSMLHVFLGTSTPSSIWKEQVLRQLLEEGVVVQEDVQLTSPAERSQTYTVLRLADRPYSPPEPLTEAKAA